MRNKIQAPGKQVLHKQVPKAQALQKEKDPRLVAVGGFGQGAVRHLYYIICLKYCLQFNPTFHPEPQHSPVSLVGAGTAVAQLGYGNCTAFWVWC